MVILLLWGCNKDKRKVKFYSHKTEWEIGEIKNTNLETSCMPLYIQSYFDTFVSEKTNREKRLYVSC